MIEMKDDVKEFRTLQKPGKVRFQEDIIARFLRHEGCQCGYGSGDHSVIGPETLTHIKKNRHTTRVPILKVIRLPDVEVLLDGVEAGTVGLADGVQVAVAYDEGLRITLLQLLQETPKGGALRGGAGVCGLALGGESAYVGYTDGVTVVVEAMGPDHLLAAALLNGAVCGDDVVIATSVPS